MELRGDELADIQYCGHPVLRAVRAVVRDHDWRTLSPTIESVSTSDHEGGVTLGLTLRFAGYGAEYQADLTLQVSGHALTVTFDGLASKNFSSNRIGLVALHWPDEAGRDILITSSDGSRAKKTFPRDISPHQPFVDVAAMTWERAGSAFHLEFTGDIFETEDQRNWTDASFKTYSTPLSRPFPVSVLAGDRVHQSLRLTAASGNPMTEVLPRKEEQNVLTLRSHVRGRVPGLGTSSSRTAVKLSVVPGLEALIVELPADDTTEAHEILKTALQQAAELGTTLDVRVTATQADDLNPILDLLPLESVTRIGVFSSNGHVTEPGLWERLCFEADRRGFTGLLIAGTRAHFTELNRRQHVLPGGADAITYSITPQMHATEVAHIVESLPIQRQTALNALRIGSGRPLHIGPVTLKARFNAVSTDRGENHKTSEQMTTDPLQTENFTAAWLLGSIAALTLPGVESVSYFEASGPRGFLADDGTPTPAFKIFRDLAALRGAEILDIQHAIPRLVLYPVTTDAGVLLFAANLTAEPRHVTVQLENGNAHTLDIPAWSTTTRRLGRLIENEEQDVSQA